MSTLKRTFLLLLVLLFLLLPLCSCAKENVSPKTEPNTAQDVAKTEDNKKEDDVDSSLPEALQGAKPDPLFFGQDPTDDGEFNVLFVGNSYSYYWLDELWGLLDAAGYENVRVCDVYASGCSFKKHWEWYENSEANYTYFQMYESTERDAWEDVSLEECMGYANWDYIGFQQTGSPMYDGGTVNGPQKFEQSVNASLPKLYRMLYENFPQAQFFWMQHWVHEVGTSEKEGLATQADQDAYYQGYKDVSLRICPKYGFTNVPLGDAWQAVRHDPLFYKTGSGEYPELTLHTRVFQGNGEPYDVLNIKDLSHDGDMGGGQYLNACVWFEVLTHKSVLDNSFVPSYFHKPSGVTYTLTDQQIQKLKTAAHDAVMACHGEDFYA